MDDEELVNKLIGMFMRLKKMPFHNLVKMDELTHNEKLVLFLLSEITGDNKIPLSILREKINLAPSTVTPIITSLEEKGLIERNIDKSDRRNIFLQVSPKGSEYTKNAQQKMIAKMKEYITFMGKDDTCELIRLMSKTSEFMKEGCKN